MAQELKAFEVTGKALFGRFYTKKVYEKSEADKVIAELENKLELYKRGWEENDKVNAYLYAELRHQKYKRCLWLAKWCEQMMVFNSKYGTDKKWHLFKKWQKRWLALAEKYKEAVE